MGVLYNGEERNPPLKSMNFKIHPDQDLLVLLIPSSCPPQDKDIWIADASKHVVESKKWDTYNILFVKPGAPPKAFLYTADSCEQLKRILSQPLVESGEHVFQETMFPMSSKGGHFSAQLCTWKPQQDPVKARASRAAARASALVVAGDGGAAQDDDGGDDQDDGEGDDQDDGEGDDQDDGEGDDQDDGEGDDQDDGEGDDQAAPAQAAPVAPAPAGDGAAQAAQAAPAPIVIDVSYEVIDVDADNNDGSGNDDDVVLRRPVNRKRRAHRRLDDSPPPPSNSHGQARASPRQPARPNYDDARHLSGNEQQALKRDQRMYDRTDPNWKKRN